MDVVIPLSGCCHLKECYSVRKPSGAVPEKYHLDRSLSTLKSKIVE